MSLFTILIRNLHLYVIIRITQRNGFIYTVVHIVIEDHLLTIDSVHSMVVLMNAL